MFCRDCLEVETDLPAVLSKAFLQVDAALAAELQMFGNGMKNSHLPKAFDRRFYPKHCIKVCLQGSHGSWDFKRSIPDTESQGILFITLLSKLWNIRDFCLYLYIFHSIYQNVIFLYCIFFIALFHTFCLLYGFYSNPARQLASQMHSPGCTC